MSIYDRIREVADPLIAQGATFEQVNDALQRELVLRMGKGGRGGADSDLADECRYCRKTGNGGHGGFCPDAQGNT